MGHTTTCTPLILREFCLVSLALLTSVVGSLQYYEGLGLSPESRRRRVEAVSRHRAEGTPPSTPHHYWDVSFPSTQECLRRGPSFPPDPCRPWQWKEGCDVRCLLKATCTRRVLTRDGTGASSGSTDCRGCGPSASRQPTATTLLQQRRPLRVG